MPQPTAADARAATRLGPHFVQFYREDDQLLDEVADFLGGAMQAGGAGLVIATPLHRVQLQQRLQTAAHQSDYTALDAEETLAGFMVDDWPDEARFDAVVGTAIDRASHGGARSVHGFGEMVALLCGRGRHEAAIRLEEMWNELGHRRRFSLYCAYPLDLFTRAEHRAAFAQVCARHTHVLPPQGRWRHAGVSEHDLAIAQLQQKAAALELEVARRIEVEQALRREEAERATLLAELQAANRAKDEFLAMLGHELRNPLAPIVTSLHLMRGRADAQSRHAQAIIERQVNHLVCLVDDLLDISKITRGKIELRTERVTIADVVAKAVEMASVLIAQRRHRLLVELPDAGIEWVGDPVRLAQVVSNLLTNSARYTPNGGEVRVRVERDGDELVIAVRDNGRGIAPHMLSRVFDIFFQGGRGVDRAEGGLGIGLALVKSLVAMHGGQVAAHSEGVGRGSEFVVRLPLEPLAGIRAQAVQGASAAVVADGARRVMVVDDNADAADMLGLALQSQGHDVTVVHDPLAALDTAGRFRPDVAVLDIGLPVMDGYELAAQLRERCGTPRLIALTGYGQESDKRRSREAGFEAHLVKPVDLDQLCELLQTRPLDGSG